MGRTIGFIGLGNMGKPMAHNLLDADFTVVGYNRSRAPVEALVEAGGQAAASPSEVARLSDVVLTCLPDSTAVREVIAGEDGVVDGLEGGEVVIDTSTISPTTVESLAAIVADHDAAMLDAPVSGGQSGAADGTLSIMIGGQESAIESASDVLETLGTTITHCGGPGAGQVTKACNQMIVSVTMEAVAEALVFASKTDADLESVIDAISDGAAACWVLDHRATGMVRGEFEPGFSVEYQHKDLRIASNAGDDYGAPMPTTETTAEIFKSAVQMGFGDEANTAIIKVIEELAAAKARIDVDENPN